MTLPDHRLFFEGELPPLVADLADVLARQREEAVARVFRDWEYAEAYGVRIPFAPLGELPALPNLLLVRIAEHYQRRFAELLEWRRVSGSRSAA